MVNRSKGFYLNKTLKMSIIQRRHSILSSREMIETILLLISYILKSQHLNVGCLNLNILCNFAFCWDEILWMKWTFLSRDWTDLFLLWFIIEQWNDAFLNCDNSSLACLAEWLLNSDIQNEILCFTWSSITFDESFLFAKKNNKKTISSQRSRHFRFSHLMILFLNNFRWILMSFNVSGKKSNQFVGPFLWDKDDIWCFEAMPHLNDVVLNKRIKWAQQRLNCIHECYDPQQLIWFIFSFSKQKLKNENRKSIYFYISWKNNRFANEEKAFKITEAMYI